jgi:hypothetical protein
VRRLDVLGPEHPFGSASQPWYSPSRGARPLIAFNTGHYQAIGLSPWLTVNPDSLREENVGVPKSETVKLPSHRVFRASKERSSN